MSEPMEVTSHAIPHGVRLAVGEVDVAAYEATAGDHPHSPLGYVVIDVDTPDDAGPPLRITVNDQYIFDTRTDAQHWQPMLRLAETIEATLSDDAVKRDLELPCPLCGVNICDVQDGDSLGLLLRTALGHMLDRSECPNSTTL